jgi:hypothetical protein
MAYIVQNEKVLHFDMAPVPEPAPARKMMRLLATSVPAPPAEYPTRIILLMANLKLL